MSINKHRKTKMAIALVALGSFLLIAGLILSLRVIKPMYFNVMSGLVIIIGTGFGLFGKQLQDKSSSDKSDETKQEVSPSRHRHRKI